MTALTQSRYAGEFLLSEGEGIISRDAITVVSGSGKLVAGAVLGQVTASKKWAPHDPAANTGIEVAKGVLFSPVDATSADQAAVAIVRYAEVKGPMLVYNAATDTAPEIAAVNVQLAAVGIIVR